MIRESPYDWPQYLAALARVLGAPRYRYTAGTPTPARTTQNPERSSIRHEGLQSDDLASS